MLSLEKETVTAGALLLIYFGGGWSFYFFLAFTRCHADLFNRLTVEFSQNIFRNRKEKDNKFILIFYLDSNQNLKLYAFVFIFKAVTIGAKSNSLQGSFDWNFCLNANAFEKINFEVDIGLSNAFIFKIFDPHQFFGRDKNALQKSLDLYFISQKFVYVVKHKTLFNCAYF